MRKGPQTGEAGDDRDGVRERFCSFWRGCKEEGKITETYMTGLRVMKMIAAGSQV